MKMLIALFVLISTNLWADAALIKKLKEGDVIFHKSQSSQSLALREITQSDWTHTGILVKNKGKWFVYEAARGVEFTPLEAWINRGAKKHYIVRRAKSEIVSLNAAAIRKMKKSFLPYLGRGYDFWFEWSDSSIYCSELIWKVYKNAFDIELSVPEKFKDFPTNGPYAQKLIQDRYVSQGRQINMEEPVVTPVALVETSLMIDIARNDN